jgi:WD40 repeat protein
MLKSSACILAGILTATVAMAEDEQPRSVVPLRELGGYESTSLHVDHQNADPTVRRIARIEDVQEDKFISSIAFVPGTHKVMTLSWMGFVTTYDGDTGARLWQRQFAGRRLSGFAVSGDGQSVVVAGEAGLLVEIDVASGADIKSYQTSGTWQTAVAINADGSLVAAGDANGYVSVWNGVTGEAISQWAAHAWPVDAVAFTSAERFVYSGDATAIKLWNADSGELIRTIGDPVIGGLASDRHLWFSSLNFSRNEDFVLAGTYDAAVLLDLASGEFLRHFVGHLMGVIGVHLVPGPGPAQDEVMTVSRDFTVRFFNANDATLARAIRLEAPLFAIMMEAVVSSDGRRLATISMDPSWARMGSFPVLRLYEVL